jgi:AAA domain
LSQAGVRVVYVSQENPRDVELRRLERLSPEPELLHVYHYTGMDLAQQDHVDWLQYVGGGAGLIVLDTLTACWSGDENSNEAMAAFDREVIRPIIGATGASVLTLDHTGHPTAFVPRKGVAAARGASAKGQKSDLFLEFKDEGNHRFLIRHGKDRIGGTREPDRTFEVIDTEDDLLDIVQVEGAEGEKLREVAEAMVTYITAAATPPSTNEVRAAMKGMAGKEIQTQAMSLLRSENPPRVRDGWGSVDTDKGRRRAKVWTLAPPELAHE